MKNLDILEKDFISNRIEFDFSNIKIHKDHFINDLVLFLLSVDKTKIFFNDLDKDIVIRDGNLFLKFTVFNGHTFVLRGKFIEGEFLNIPEDDFYSFDISQMTFGEIQLNVLYPEFDLSE